MKAKAGWVALTVGAALLLSACSQGQPDLQDPSPPITSVNAAPPSTSQSMTLSSSISSSESAAAETTAPVDQETADRAAIETAWIEYTTAREKLAVVPINDRAAVMAPYAVDPILTMALDKAEELASQGQIGYGAPISSITWPTPIGGADTATFDDCSDSSKMGIQNATTGELLTKGPDVELIRVTAARGTDSVWRISRIEYMVNEKCSR